jgi:hypothetical protein
MNKSILTVDEAFQGTNFLVLRNELENLNAQGVYDDNFFPMMQNFIETPEAWQNLKDASGVVMQ